MGRLVWMSSFSWKGRCAEILSAMDSVGMKVAHVQAEDRAPRQGVVRVEVVGARRVVFHAQAEELALDGVHAGRPDAQCAGPGRRPGIPPGVRGVRRRSAGWSFAPSGIQWLFTQTSSSAIPDGLRDSPAGHAVPHPEFTDILVRMCQGVPVVRLRMGEIRGVEVQPDTVFLRPGYPAGEVFGFEPVPVHDFAARVAVGSVDVRAVPPRQQVDRLLQVGAQLIAVSRPARIVPGGHDAAAFHGLILRFEPCHVVGLPAVKRNGHAQRPLHRQPERPRRTAAYCSPRPAGKRLRSALPSSVAWYCIWNFSRMVCPETAGRSLVPALIRPIPSTSKNRQ